MSSLESQVIKIFRHARQGSIETRRVQEMHASVCQVASCNFSHAELKNLSNKHVAAYVKHLLAEGVWQPI